MDLLHLQVNPLHAFIICFMLNRGLVSYILYLHYVISNQLFFFLILGLKNGLKKKRKINNSKNSYCNLYC